MWYIAGQAEDFDAAKDIRLFHMRPWLEELGAKAMNAYIGFTKKANNDSIWGRIADLILAFARLAWIPSGIRAGHAHIPAGYPL